MGMKKISLEQLIRESRAEEYAEQYRYICGLIEQQKIMPVKSSSLNGKKPALYQKFWLLEDVPDYTEEMEELQFHMSPIIRTDYYLNHLDVYREERKWVMLLNRYFLEQPAVKGKAAAEPADVVSLNERSFQIWGREKFLQREQGRKILAHCGVDLEQLQVYTTTEPLAYYSALRDVPQTILILENKDTFYSMRRHLMGEIYEKNFPVRGGTPQEESIILRDGTPKAAGILNRRGSSGRIFGEKIGTVVYGAGKGILRSVEDFRFCVEPHINAPENRIVYFGDLDYEGIGIYEHLAVLFGKVRPFVQAYTKMVEKAEQCGLDFLPESSEKQNRNVSGLFLQYFSPEMRQRIGRILDAGKYIPQEILNITDF